MLQNDTICAIATSPGGAIGVIRVSGSDAIYITSKIFEPHKGLPLEKRQNYSLSYGKIQSTDGEIIDEAIVAIFKAPHSYTGETSTEISCHGSSYILQKVILLLIENGCRVAEPGEFTKRAFFNGKMDLSQAEAVAELIASTNSATHKIALSQLRGGFSSELAILRDQLLHITSLLELELDFSDHEELEFADRSELLQLTHRIKEKINKLVKSFQTGKAIRQGIPVAIIGKTNVGKSTLLNRLLHDDKAIVSDIHGTTRDIIEDVIQIKNLMFRFIDTAGIRQTEDTIEKIGIERTFKKVSEASIVLWVIDAIPTQEEINDVISITEGKKLITVLNKIDKNTIEYSPTIPSIYIEISAKENINLDKLEQVIFEAAEIPEINSNDVIITSARHYDALVRASESIDRILYSLTANIPSDLIAEDLRICLEQLSEITGGQITSSEVLLNIFSHFCIGK